MDSINFRQRKYRKNIKRQFCQNGSWKKSASGSFGGFYIKRQIRRQSGQACIYNNPVTGTCSCPDGTSSYGTYHNTYSYKTGQNDATHVNLTETLYYCVGID